MERERANIYSRQETCDRMEKVNTVMGIGVNEHFYKEEEEEVVV